MSRAGTIARAQAYARDRLFDDLAQLVAIRSESQDPARAAELDRYLVEGLGPVLTPLGFVCERFANPEPGSGPFLVARRTEPGNTLTMLTYGHGDVVPGYDDSWQAGLDPWQLSIRDGRWYGRGSADNKGQHLLNLQALAALLAEEGRLGFDVIALIETGEERGSPGLRRFCTEHRELLRADLLIASDGPRLAAGTPTLFMGSRGLMNLDFVVELREGGHHSGNWGGLLANPAVILTHALASIVDPKGRILVEGWRPEAIPEPVRDAVKHLQVGGGTSDPAIDPAWGEPGLSPGEQLFAWNSFEILTFLTGTPSAPANAVPPKATARGHLRFVPPLNPETILPALRAHLDAHGFAQVQVTNGDSMQATRLLPDDPAVCWAAASIAATTGKSPALLPNLAGSLPNDVFAELLGLKTLWVPHSYAACSQHAPNEHALPEILDEGIAMMAGLWWDLAHAPPDARSLSSGSSGGS